MRIVPSRPSTQAQPAEGRHGLSDYDDEADVEEDDDDVHLVKLSWAESAEMFSEEDNLSLEQVLTNLIFQQGLSSSLTIQHN